MKKFILTFDHFNKTKQINEVLGYKMPNDTIYELPDKKTSAHRTKQPVTENYKLTKKERRFVKDFVDGNARPNDFIDGGTEVINVSDYYPDSNYVYALVVRTGVGTIVVGQIDWNNNVAIPGFVTGYVSKPFINAFKRDCKNADWLTLDDSKTIKDYDHRTKRAIFDSKNPQKVDEKVHTVHIDRNTKKFIREFLEGKKLNEDSFNDIVVTGESDKGYQQLSLVNSMGKNVPIINIDRVNEKYAHGYPTGVKSKSYIDYISKIPILENFTNETIDVNPVGDIIESDFQIFIPKDANELLEMYGNSVNDHIRNGCIAFTIETKDGCFTVIYDGKTNIDYYDEIGASNDAVSADWLPLFDNESMAFEKIYTDQQGYVNENDGEKITIYKDDNSYDAKFLNNYGMTCTINTSEKLHENDNIKLHRNGTVYNMIVKNVYEDGYLLKMADDMIGSNLWDISNGKNIQIMTEDFQADVEVVETKYLSKNVISVKLNESAFFNNETINVIFDESMVLAKIIDIYEENDCQFSTIHLTP